MLEERHQPMKDSVCGGKTTALLGRASMEPTVYVIWICPCSLGVRDYDRESMVLPEESSCSPKRTKRPELQKARVI